MHRLLLATALFVAAPVLAVPTTSHAADIAVTKADWKAQVKSRAAFMKLRNPWFRALRFGSYKKLEKLDDRLARWSADALSSLKAGPQTAEAKTAGQKIQVLYKLPVEFESLNARKSTYGDKSRVLDSIEDAMNKHVAVLEANWR